MIEDWSRRSEVSVYDCDRGSTATDEGGGRHGWSRLAVEVDGGGKVVIPARRYLYTRVKKEKVGPLCIISIFLSMEARDLRQT